MIYRDGKDKADQVVPISTFDSENPEDLWKWMDAWEEKTGGSLLAIPHNGNLSNGQMFALNDLRRQPADSANGPRQRARWEPMYEITQIKGDGETHPSLSPNDEFANFEKWDKANLAGVPKKPGMIETEYARRAPPGRSETRTGAGRQPVQVRLRRRHRHAHRAATAEEDNFFGKHTGVEPSPHRWEHAVISRPRHRGLADGRRRLYRRVGDRQYPRGHLGRAEAQGGLLDHRPAHAGALLRRVGLHRSRCADPHARRRRLRARACRWAAISRDAPAGKAPDFLVAAHEGPVSAAISTAIQIVKGWVDANGKLHEKVYDVAWSGDRKPGPDGKLPPVGNTVDVANATWTNTIGAPELIAVWKDPDFDPTLRAVYYGRVLEIPTPRWTAYDAKRFGSQDVAGGPDDHAGARLHLADLVHPVSSVVIEACRL